jgi:hypothetical protein
MNKTYDYTQYISGRDYFFELLNGGMTACMTAEGSCPKCGDRILLKNGDKTYQYQIEQIDYYCNPSDMWMALLKQVAVK